MADETLTIVPGENFFVDGHLDLGAAFDVDGRDLTRSVAEIRQAEGPNVRNVSTISLPALRDGQLGLVFATLWALPATADIGFGAIATSDHVKPYATPEEAEILGLRQLDIYRRWADEGRVRIVESQADLAAHLRKWPTDRVPGFVILMEGADPIVRPEDAAAWKSRGLRMVGLSWGRTRYAGGTGAPGGLTPEGRELVIAMNEAGLVLDISHLAEQSFWEAMDLKPPHVMASHSAARALVPGDRQITDDMIAAIGQRDGVVGLPLFNRFLEPSWRPDNRVEVTAAKQLKQHVEHIAGLIGWDKVAIGSDLDGGFGRDQSVAEIDTIADFRRLGETFSPEQARDLLGGNWLRYLAKILPAG